MCDVTTIHDHTSVSSKENNSSASNFSGVHWSEVMCAFCLRVRWKDKVVPAYPLHLSFKITEPNALLHEHVSWRTRGKEENKGAENEKYSRLNCKQFKCSHNHVTHNSFQNACLLKIHKLQSLDNIYIAFRIINVKFSHLFRNEYTGANFYGMVGYNVLEEMMTILWNSLSQVIRGIYQSTLHIQQDGAPLHYCLWTS